jgi:glycosyltransferase involved in cell wall biosynthesis
MILNSQNGWKGYIEIIRLYNKARKTHSFDTIILGFRTTELYYLIKLLSPGKKIIYDCFVPLYPAFRYENKWHINSILRKILSPLVFIYEKYQLHYSSTIICDTLSHIQILDQLYGVGKKTHAIYLGNPVEIDMNDNSMHLPSRNFTVFYYGTAQPLHGTALIVETAIQLTAKYKNMEFILVGTIPASYTEHIQNNDQITYYKWKAYPELMHLANNSKLCIGGPLGNTNQSQRVITGKTFQFMSMGKCTIIGINKETEYFNFVHRKNCLLVKQGIQSSLAKEIIWAFNNQNQLSEIGAAGKELFNQEFSDIQLKKKICDLIQY